MNFLCLLYVVFVSIPEPQDDEMTPYEHKKKRKNHDTTDPTKNDMPTTNIFSSTTWS